MKEALFSMLTPYVHGAVFLDLCAGTGSIGLEALSRGASRAVLVDITGPCLRALRANVSDLGAEDQVDIVSCDAVRYLRRCLGEERAFDVIFTDPPYGSPISGEALLQLIETPHLITPLGVAVFEHRDALAPGGEEELGEALGNTLRLVTTRRYGETHITIIAREED